MSAAYIGSQQLLCLQCKMIHFVTFCINWSLTPVWKIVCANFYIFAFIRLCTDCLFANFGCNQQATTGAYVKKKRQFVTRIELTVLMFVSKSKSSSCVSPEQKQQQYFVTSVEVEEVVVCHQSFAITRCYHLLTHLLVHSFTQSFTHLLSQLSQHSVTHSLSHTQSHSRAQYPITPNLFGSFQESSFNC